MQYISQEYTIFAVYNQFESTMILRLIILSFLQFAVWGTYLTSMGSYLVNIGLADKIGLFYAMQGVVSLFMPALMGIIADRWIPAQRLLSICHLLASLFMGLAGYYGMTAGNNLEFGSLFFYYSLGIAFYMPTLALSNSVSYNALDNSGLDAIAHFPRIRLFGTIGFICSMWIVDLCGLQDNYGQFLAYAAIGIVCSLYALTLPSCPINTEKHQKSLYEALGLHTFVLFKQRRLAVFFIFSILLGVSLQITNGFANPYISSFASLPQYANTFGVQHANILISLSQASEAFCILLIPFCLKRWGIKRVIILAMLAWSLRFALFGIGNPGNGVWMFILSMIVYGIAFDFFNISGSLFVDREANKHIRSGAQGLFFMMTNGFGATLGNLGAQAIVSHFVDFNSKEPQIVGWQSAWLVFASYALFVAIAFALIFKNKETNNNH